MSQDLNVPADRPDDASPVRSNRPRRRIPARLAAIAGLSMVAVMAVVALSLTGPPARADSFSDCVNEAVVRISATAATLPAAQRNAYLQTEIALARTRCGAALVGTTTPTTTTTTTTTTSTTTTTTPTSPSTTTTTLSNGRYQLTVNGTIGTGSQTLEANCRTGDRLVSSSYQVGNPTGSTTSRSVSLNTTNQGARLTYEVVGTVANPKTSLTIVCRSV